MREEGRVAAIASAASPVANGAISGFRRCACVGRRAGFCGHADGWTDGDIPGIRVAVNELRRSSSAVTLKFTIYNDTDAELDISGKDEPPVNCQIC